LDVLRYVTRLVLFAVFTLFSLPCSLCSVRRFHFLQFAAFTSCSLRYRESGEERTVHCEGDLLLTGAPRGSVLLTSVLHVPTLGINLMSTPQITSKKGSCWEGEHAAHVYDRNGKVILKGHKVDGMYR
jgi:hypothetical protein